MGSHKRRTPQEPGILAGAMVQEGFKESACVGSSRASSYTTVEGRGNCVLPLAVPEVPPGAVCAGGVGDAAQTAPGALCRPAAASSLGALLGNNARTPASRASRGFQPITRDFSGNSGGPVLVEEVDAETGEIFRFEVTPQGRKPYRSPEHLRAERYALKSVVNRLYPRSRTAKCCRMRIPHKSVSILKAPEFNKAHYAGLSRCSSVWLCPVCAAKIAQGRRAELSAAVATAKAMGWHVMLMTCTVPHGLGDDVAGMLDLMLKAWRKMTDDRKGKDMRRLFDLRGTVRALEVTDGPHGFHPHFHALLFIGADFSPASVQAGFLPLWQEACVKVGLPCPSDSHGLRVDDGAWAAQYASKWGLEDEMVKGHLKRSRGVKGMTPWDLLRNILATGSRRSEERFRLYADAFKGRRQLYWSNGLKAKLGMGEVSDEELVARQEESAYVLAELTEEQWRAILATHSEAAVLEVAESGGPGDLLAFLEGLQAMSRAGAARGGPAAGGGVPLRPPPGS